MCTFFQNLPINLLFFSKVEPEPATAEPSAKQVDVEASSEPNHITPDSEPKPEGEPSAEVFFHHFMFFEYSILLRKFDGKINFFQCDLF